MRKFSYYLVFWAVLVALFHVICFLAPDWVFGLNKHGGAFWPVYGFMMIGFILHLIYSWFAFSEKNAEKRILNRPVTVLSFVELAVMIAAGVSCLRTVYMPEWMGVIIGYAVLGISVILLVSTKAVTENTDAANRALNESTRFMREMTSTAQGIVTQAKMESMRKIAEKVYEAIRYADPVSSVETRADEIEIAVALDEMENLLQRGANEEIFRNKADEVIILVKRRNEKCKAVKRRM